MSYFRKLLFRLIFFFAVLSMGGGHSIAQEIQSFRIRAGTLEPVEQPGKHGYIFHSEEGEDESFVIDTDEYLKSKSVEMMFPYPPGLRPIGFKLDNGVEYFYKTPEGARSELATVQAAAKEHPDSKGIAWLFEGQARSRVELAIHGPTPVLRTDLTIGNKKITLWATRKAIK